MNGDRGPVSYPYIATGRTYGDLIFDFVIANEMAAQWYDVAPNQVMPERAWCRDYIQPGAMVVDAGAHHGMLSLLFSYWAGDNGRVIAYEPLVDNAAIITRNAVLNGRNNIEVRTRGLGDAPRVASARMNRTNVMVAGGDEEPFADQNRGDHDLDQVSGIQIVRLDDDLDDPGAVDFLKVDVEGSDVAALRGAQAVLDGRPYVDMEIHNFLFEDRIASLTEIVSLLGVERFRFAALPDLFGDFIHFDLEPDIELLATWDNPHLLCAPF